jgi:hypothetical protein
MYNFPGFSIDFTQGDYGTYLADDTMSAILVDLRTGRKLKTFKGETAWSDASRAASDKALAELYG